LRLKPSIGYIYFIMSQKFVNWCKNVIENTASRNPFFKLASVNVNYGGRGSGRGPNNIKLGGSEFLTPGIRIGGQLVNPTPPVDITKYKPNPNYGNIIMGPNGEVMGKEKYEKLLAQYNAQVAQQNAQAAQQNIQPSVPAYQIPAGLDASIDVPQMSLAQPVVNPFYQYQSNESAQAPAQTAATSAPQAEAAPSTQQSVAEQSPAIAPANQQINKSPGYGKYWSDNLFKNFTNAGQNIRNAVTDPKYQVNENDSIIQTFGKDLGAGLSAVGALGKSLLGGALAYPAAILHDAPVAAYDYLTAPQRGKNTVIGQKLEGLNRDVSRTFASLNPNSNSRGVSNSASSNKLINNNPFQELADKNKSPEVQQPAAPAPVKI
jgi:hypothetical protein